MRNIILAILYLQGHQLTDKYLKKHPVGTEIQSIAKAIRHFSKKLGIDPLLEVAVIKAESGFNPDAKNSKTNALGLTQLMRGEATHGYETLTDQELMEIPLNVQLGVRHIVWWEKRCKTNNPIIYLNAYDGLGCSIAGNYSKTILDNYSEVMVFLADWNCRRHEPLRFSKDKNVHKSHKNTP